MIEMSMHHACAVVDGKVTCWGYNSYGVSGGSGSGSEFYEPEGTIDYGYGAVTYTYAYGSKQTDLGVSKELTDICAPCVANEYVQQRYESGSYTVEAGQTSYTCNTLAECEPQCSGDANCVGYTEDKGLEAVAFGRGAGFHQSILFSDGSVRCWALDGYGDRCGTDDDSTFYNVNDPSTWGLTKLSGPAIAVADVAYGGCALMQDGSLECWMDYAMNWFVFVNPGTSGKVGNDATNPMETHRALDTGSYRFKNISSSDSGMCGILKGADEGKVACFGYFGYTGGPGAGYSSPTHSVKPLPIMDFGSPAKDLSCGDDHCCFLLDDNSIKCFGANSYGQLGIGSTTVVQFPDMVESVDIGTHVPAKIYCERKSTHVITTTGDLIGWGGNEQHELGYNDADYAFGNKQGDAAGEMGANLIVTMTNVRDMGGRVCNINALVTNDDIMYTTTNVAQTPSWVQRATNVNLVGTNGGCYGPKYFYVKNDGMFGGKDAGENPAYATLNMKNMGLTCITCAGGTYNRPGDTAAGTCDDDETCNANFYSDGTQCVACPSGSTSVGAAVIDGNSYCKRNAPCGVDEYVNEDSVCGTCPFGQFSDATATEYTATPCLKPAATCGENEHSSIQYLDVDTRYFGNTCTNCETDCTNDATCLGYTPGNKIVSMTGYYHFGCSASSEGVKCWGNKQRRRTWNW